MLLKTKIIILAVLIVLSAFFSGVETALISLGKLRITHLVKEKKRGAKAVEKLKEDMPRLLTTILIGNNLVNVGASALATAVAIDMFKIDSLVKSKEVFFNPAQ